MFSQNYSLSQNFLQTYGIGTAGARIGTAEKSVVSHLPLPHRRAETIRVSHRGRVTQGRVGRAVEEGEIWGDGLTPSFNEEVRHSIQALGLKHV